jgi:amino acid adenylation domain-containing protein/thioester reductase-like protein
MYKIRLSPYAEIFYNEWLLDPESYRYNLSVDQILHGNLDVARLNNALKRYISEHVLLNSHIKDINGKPHWIRNADISDLEYSYTPTSKTELFAYISKGFYLYNGPLYRFKLMYIAKETYRFIFVLHHLLMDGGASGEQGLFHEVSNYYNHPKYRTKYSIAQQIELITNLTTTLYTRLKQDNTEHKSFWHEQLLEVDSLNLRFLKLYEANNKGVANTGINPIGEIRFCYADADASKLSKIKHQYAITPYVYGQCIFAMLLHKYTGQEKLIINFPIAIREGRDFIYGAQLNTNLIPYRFTSATTPLDLLKQGREFFKSLKHGKTNHSYYPIADIIQEGGKDLLGAVFAQTSFRDVPFTFEGITKVEIISELLVDSVAKDALVFEQEQKRQEFHCRVRYNKNFIDMELVNNFVNSYKKLFNEVLKDLANGKDSKPISSYQLLTKKQIKEIVYKYNQTDKPYPQNKTINELFEEQALKTPNDIAVVCKNNKLTYQELNQRANLLAIDLQNNHDFKLSELVVLWLDRSEFMLLAMLAVLKVGGAYVPIDADIPIARLSYILGDTEAKIILVDKSTFHKLKQVNNHYLKKVLVINNKTTQNKTGTVQVSNPKTTFSSNNLAYVIYTSGTMGNPKGVMVEHKSVVNYIYAIAQQYSNIKNVDFSSNLAFDLSVTTTLFPLITGKTIFIYSGKLVEIGDYIKHINAHRIELIKSTPNFLANIASNLINKRLIACIVGGEILERNVGNHILNYTEQLVDEYGPTEATVGATALVISQKNYKSTIGKPYANYKVYILDHNLDPLPIGVIGELYIGGDGLAREYLNQPKLTANKFIINPFQTADEKNQNKNKRLYKTGDFVRMLPDGNLEYIGRSDSQIKIRGYRIELSEIENKLAKYPGIKQVLVLSKNKLVKEISDKYLVAYYVAKFKLDEKKILSFLYTQLPEYMVPAVIIYISKFPLTVNGKINYQALPNPQVDVGNKYVAPSSEREYLICEAFSKILNLKNVGVEDDFFNKGGSSIQAIQLMVELQTNFDIKVNDIFNLRTPRKLAENLHFGKDILKHKLKQLKLFYQKNQVKENTISAASWKQLQSKVDAYNESVHKLHIDYSLQKPITNILLTGATGYLGCNLLNQLLALTNYKIFLLVRAQSQEAAKKRINEKFHFYFSKTLENEINQRVFIFKSNLEENDLDLSLDEYDLLKKEIDSVIHVAALVKHYGEYDKFYAANVQATINLLEFTKHTKTKDFHYISTYSVLTFGFVPECEVYAYTEDDSPTNLELWPNAYIQTKLLGEQETIKYRQYGINSSIYRVGNLAFMAENCRVQENIHTNAFFNWLKCLYKMQCIAQDINMVEISPVDLTANAIVKLFDKEQLSNKIHHVFNPNLLNISEIFKNTKKLLITQLTIVDFMEYVADNLDNNIYHGLIVRFLLQQGWLDGNYAKHITSIKVLQDKTQYILRQLHFNWEPISVKIFTQYFDLLGESQEVNMQKTSGAKKTQNTLSKKHKQFLKFVEEITSTIPAFIYWKDKNCVYQGANKFSVQYFGQKFVDELPGKTDYELWPELAEQYIADDKEVMMIGKSLRKEDIFFYPNNPTEMRYCIVTKAPLRDENNEVIGIICNSIDITAEKEVERLKLETELQKLQLQQAEKIREITAQVSHDINSPLTSLKMIISNLQNVDEETRVIIRNATNRINDIANNLVIKYGKTGEIESAKSNTAIAPEIISCLISNILSEKRAQYSDQNISFELHIADDTQGLFANVSHELCKRVMSNIVNNAVEAIGKAERELGCINVAIAKQDDYVCIQIKDNGCGFPKEVRAKLGTEKVSTKIEAGHGIGLSTAIQHFKAWGGDYAIDSKHNVGVTFTIRLPIAAAPQWFQEQLYVPAGATIVILDDDQSIHDVWDTRFKDYVGKVTLKHFNNSEALFSQNAQLPTDAIYLIDYELLGSKDTGIEVIKKLRDLDSATFCSMFLVTSRYEDEKIKAACAELNIKLIPKNFAPYIPITITASATAANTVNDSSTIDVTTQPDYIFIDDDVTLVNAWKMDAAFKGVNLAAFTSIREFEKAKHQYHKDVPIYIDYVLGADDGVKYSKQLAEEGFNNIYLASGYDRSFFTEPMPWLKAIVGKMPPQVTKL